MMLARILYGRSPRRPSAQRLSAQPQHRRRARSLGTVLAVASLAVAALATTAAADDVRPVHLEITETTPGDFLVQWRVPKVMAPTMMPGPVLPDHCRADDRVSVEELAAAWINRQSYVCAEELPGHEIGMAFPQLNVALSTLVRVELLSGDSFSHMLLPGEPSWRVPDIDAGGFPRLARDASRAVVAGAWHALHPAHVALLLALCLFGSAQGLRLAGLFTTGQVAGVIVFAAAGTQAGAGLAELAVAVAAGVLARQALLEPGARRQLGALAVAGGVAHGLGVAGIVAPPTTFAFATATWSLMVVLGMDAALVLGVIVILAAVHAIRRPTVTTGGEGQGAEARPAPAFAVYAVAVGAFAVALIPPAGDPADAAESEGLRLSRLPVPAAGVALGNTGRVAAQFPDAVIQTFVSIEAFEVRRETLVRVAGMAAELGLAVDGEIAVEAQQAVRDRVAGLVAARSTLLIDGEPAVTASQRVDFMEVDNQGALPRAVPVPEPVADALIGVTTVSLLSTTPQRVALEWTDFASAGEVPATVTDPEASGTTVLTAEAPALEWLNQLAEDPAPVVTATAVEPASLWLPLASLVVLAAALVWTIGPMRRRRDATSLALLRIMLAVALLVAPIANVAVAMPESFGMTPDANGARRILSGVLPNIYKAFEFRDEATAFDRLSLSVTGDTLTEVYLEHQRALEMEERGGARARVEAFEVTDVSDIRAGEGGGFVAEAGWNVGGTVVHFGHRHFRQNRYEARVVVVPVEGSWKIESITILDEERLR